jgi:hypothetical protein
MKRHRGGSGDKGGSIASSSAAGGGGATTTAAAAAVGPWLSFLGVVPSWPVPARPTSACVSSPMMSTCGGHDGRRPDQTRRAQEGLRHGNDQGPANLEVVEEVAEGGATTATTTKTTTTTTKKTTTTTMRTQRSRRTAPPDVKGCQVMCR